jgi:hypothetical protein
MKLFVLRNSTLSLDKIAGLISENLLKKSHSKNQL